MAIFKNKMRYAWTAKPGFLFQATLLLLTSLWMAGLVKEAQATSLESVALQALTRGAYPEEGGVSRAQLAREVAQTLRTSGTRVLDWNASEDEVWPNVLFFKLVTGASGEELAATFFNYEDQRNNPNNAAMGLIAVNAMPQTQDPLLRQVNYRINLITLLGTSLGGLIHIIGSEAAYSLLMRLSRVETGDYQFSWRLAAQTAKMRVFNGSMIGVQTDEGLLLVCMNNLQPGFSAIAGNWSDRPAAYISNLVNGLVARTMTLKTSNSPSERTLYLDNLTHLRAAFSR